MATCICPRGEDLSLDAECDVLSLEDAVLRVKKESRELFKIHKMFCWKRERIWDRTNTPMNDFLTNRKNEREKKEWEEKKERRRDEQRSANLNLSPEKQQEHEIRIVSLNPSFSLLCFSRARFLSLSFSHWPGNRTNPPNSFSPGLLLSLSLTFSFFFRLFSTCNFDSIFYFVKVDE